MLKCDLFFEIFFGTIFCLSHATKYTYNTTFYCIQFFITEINYSYDSMVKKAS